MVGQRRRTWRRRALARRLAPLVAAAGVVAVVAALAVGAVAQISPSSVSYRRTVDRGYAALAQPFVVQSDSSVPLLEKVLEHGPSLDRGVFFADLGQLESTSQSVARAFEDLSPPSPTTAAASGCLDAMAGRAVETGHIVAALEGLLGGLTGTGSHAGDEAAAASSVQSVGTALRADDAKWASCRSSLRRAAGHARIGASRWVSNPSLFAPDQVASYVASLTSSPTLAAVHIVAIVEAVTVPATSESSTGTVLVPPTTRLAVHVVVADDGNVDEEGVQVNASLSPTGADASSEGGPVSVSLGHAVSLTAGASTVLVLPSFAVDPGDSYSLRVVVTAPSEPGTPVTTTIPVSVATAVTTTSVLGSPVTASVGGKVTYTATITSSPADLPQATGTISFDDDSSPIATCQAVTVSRDQASCTVTYPSKGTHAVTAVYSGDASRSASTSAPLYEPVGPAPTSSGSSS